MPDALLDLPPVLASRFKATLFLSCLNIVCEWFSCETSPAAALNCEAPKSPDSPKTSKANFLALPQCSSSLLFSEISNPWASFRWICSTLSEQSPPEVVPNRDTRSWNCSLTWPLFSLLKAMLRREKKGLLVLKLIRTSTLHLHRPRIASEGVKVQGMTTQEPATAWTRSGTEGTGVAAWMVLLTASAGEKTQKNHPLLKTETSPGKVVSLWLQTFVSWTTWVSRF